MPEKPKFSKGMIHYFIIATAVCTIILLSAGINMIDYNIGGYLKMLALSNGIPLAIYLVFFAHQWSRYNLAKTNFEQYAREETEKQKRAEERARQERIAEQARQERIEQERQRAILSQQNTSPWAVKYSTYPCPHCGHYKVRCAKWEDKKLSVAFWGIASTKLAANYKCEHCGEMWE